MIIMSFFLLCFTPANKKKKTIDNILKGAAQFYVARSGYIPEIKKKVKKSYQDGLDIVPGSIFLGWIASDVSGRYRCRNRAIKSINE